MEVLRSYSPTSHYEAMTGHHAPTSGWWRPRLRSQEPRYVHQVELMPTQQGSQTVWVLIEQVHPSHTDLVFSYTTGHLKEVTA